MGKGMCGSCTGKGQITCSSCGGRRHVSRMTMKGEVEITPCAVCYGRGRIKCPFCGGSGYVDTLDLEKGDISGSEKEAIRPELQKFVDEYLFLREMGETDADHAIKVYGQLVGFLNKAWSTVKAEGLTEKEIADMMMTGEPDITLIDWMRQNEWIE